VTVSVEVHSAALAGSETSLPQAIETPIHLFAEILAEKMLDEMTSCCLGTEKRLEVPMDSRGKLLSTVSILVHIDLPSDVRMEHERIE
jgi:hypothetical protein